MYRSKTRHAGPKRTLKPVTSMAAAEVAHAVNMDFATQSMVKRVAMLAKHHVYLPKNASESQDQIAEGYFFYIDKVAIDPHSLSEETVRDINGYNGPDTANSPRRSPVPFHALLVFDWNDVLFPNWALQQSVDLREAVMPPLPPSLLASVQSLDRKLVRLLSLAASLGRVSILAGSSQRFVRQSMKHYLPLVQEFAQQAHIAVVSARTAYEWLYPDDDFARKSLAFHEHTRAALGGVAPVRQSFKFVTVGSGRCEREAAHDLRHRIPLDCIKIVELREHPTIEDVAKNAEKVARMLPELVLSEEFCCQFVQG